MNKLSLYIIDCEKKAFSLNPLRLPGAALSTAAKVNNATIGKIPLIGGLARGVGHGANITGKALSAAGGNPLLTYAGYDYVKPKIQRKMESMNRADMPTPNMNKHLRSMA